MKFDGHWTPNDALTLYGNDTSFVKFDLKIKIFQLNF